MRIRAVLVVPLLAVVALAGDPVAATRELVRVGAGAAGFANYLAALGNIALVPDISAANYRIDNGQRISTWKLPGNTTASLGEGKPPLFLEGGLGYLRSRFTADLLASDPATLTRVDETAQGFAVFAGVGPRFEVSEGLAFTPILNFGWSRLESDADYNGPRADVLGLLADGLVFNWTVEAINYGVAGRLDFERRAGTLEYGAILRYDLLRTESYRYSDPAQDFSVTTQLFNLRLDLAGPLGVAVASRPIGWRLFFANTSFTDGTGNKIGFDWYNEYGIAFETRVDDLPVVVSKLRLGVSYIHGNGVTGVNFIFGVAF